MSSSSTGTGASANDPAPRYSADALEHALDLWRDGWKQTQRPDLPADWQDEYQLAASAVALAALHTCQTMQDLLRWYYHPAEDKRLDAALRGACNQATLQSGHILNSGLVEDAAFWQRYCMLVGRAVNAAGEGRDQ